MPTLENTVPFIDAKSLNRKASRSAVVFSARKAAFIGNVVPKLERATKALHERLCELRDPVEKLDKDGNVVRVHDDMALCKVVGAMLAAIEAERCLLGFPSPGKRRDEGAGELKSAQSPAVVDVAQVQSSAAQAESVQAQAPSEPMPSGSQAVSDGSV